MTTTSMAHEVGNLRGYGRGLGVSFSHSAQRHRQTDDSMIDNTMRAAVISAKIVVKVGRNASELSSWPLEVVTLRFCVPYLQS